MILLRCRDRDFRASTVQKPKRGRRSNLLSKFKYRNVRATAAPCRPGIRGSLFPCARAHGPLLPSPPPAAPERPQRNQNRLEPLRRSSGSAVCSSVPAAALSLRAPRPGLPAGRGAGEGATPRGSSVRSLPPVSAGASCPLQPPTVPRVASRLLLLPRRRRGADPGAGGSPAAGASPRPALPGREPRPAEGGDGDCAPGGGRACGQWGARGKRSRSWEDPRLS